MKRNDIQELLLVKDMYRTKHGLYIENNLGERGSANHKTKPYFTCEFKKRITSGRRRGLKFNAWASYQTFDTYEEALEFSIKQAPDVLKEWKQLDKKNKLIHQQQ